MKRSNVMKSIVHANLKSRIPLVGYRQRIKLIHEAYTKGYINCAEYSAFIAETIDDHEHGKINNKIKRDPIEQKMKEGRAVTDYWGLIIFKEMKRKDALEAVGKSIGVSADAVDTYLTKNKSRSKRAREAVLSIKEMLSP